jgi:hypothetical protein
LTARIARALALTLTALAIALPALPLGASEMIEARNIRLEPSVSDGWVLSADFDLPLPERIEDAVSRGVALYFVVEFELLRPRWYWFDEKAAEASRTYRLSYHALTRQYRISLDGLGWSYASLDQALESLGRLRGWRVIVPEQVQPGTSYDAQVRMRLDLTRLPKPFQVTAIANRDWNLQAEWNRFKFNP